MMNDTDIYVFDDTGNGTDQSSSGTDSGSSPVEDLPDTGDSSASAPADSSSDLPVDETNVPEDTENGSETSSSDTDMVTDAEGNLTGETTADGEPVPEVETSGVSKELVQHIDDILTEHSSAFDSYVKSTVSGNGININLDDYSTELLETSVQNQGIILEKMDYLGSLLLIIFLVLVVDYLYRQAKRIIKNFMKGDDTNE